MTFQVKTPNVTEIQVRMDCNGCVEKIRKAVQTVQGIYEFHEDIPKQKIIIVGWADPELVIRAIKKAGKIAKLCSHTIGEEDKPTERADAANTSSSSAETVTVEENKQTVTEENTAATTATEDPPPPLPEDPPPQENGETQAQEILDPPPQEETSCEIVHDPRDSYYMDIETNNPRHGYLIRNGLDRYQIAHEYLRDAEYREYPRYNYPDYVDPRHQRYIRDQYNNNNNGGGGSSYGNSRATVADSNRFATMFSDENPNACCIS